MLVMKATHMAPGEILGNEVVPGTGLTAHVGADEEVPARTGPKWRTQISRGRICSTRAVVFLVVRN